ncbi:MAG: hypothetical protein IID16_00810 [Candidatus Marinimicrobia bacterium]|nr:hypothetical protein [Candidatus Neomarinimicrobiota bacterium]
MNELQKIESFDSEISLIQTVDEAKLQMDTAARYAVFIKAGGVMTETQNKFGRLRIKLEDKTGALLDKDYAHGGEHGNKFTKVAQGNLGKMPVNKKVSARARKICDAADDIKEQIMKKIEDRGEVITPNRVLTGITAIKQKKKHDDIMNNVINETIGKYDVIVIDPPWDVKKIERDVAPNQSKELDYPTMTIEEISAIELPAKENAHIFMWTTHKFLPLSFAIFKEWGVKYVLTMVWHKPGGFQPYNLPQYNNEFCLYGRIGSPKFIDTKQFNTCNSWPRGRHSEKPIEFYELINRVCGGEKIDIFNRREIEGFNTWGNESN